MDNSERLFELDSYSDEIALTSESNHLSKVKFYRFNDLFYKKVRNEITEHRLSFLHNLALNIEEPHLFGTFKSNTHYLKTLKLLHLSTQETRNRKFFLANIFLKMMPYHGNMLDVGCGYGDITKLMTRYFKEITATDIEEERLEYIKNIKAKHCRILVQKKDILDFVFPEKYYDLVLFSHSLYYIKKDYWIDIITESFKSLKNKGIILIILTYNKEKKRIGEFFDGRPSGLVYLINQCAKKFSPENIECIISDEFFTSKSLLGMSHICNILLNDVKASAKKEELISYIENYLFSSELQRYILTAEQFFLIIRNNS